MPLRFFPFVCFCAVAFTTGLGADTQLTGSSTARPKIDLPNTTNNGQYLLFNGWKLSPAGKVIPLPGDMPVKMLWADGGRMLLIQMAGFHDQGISLFDPASKKITKTIPLAQTWPGMCLSPDLKTLFVSGGNTGAVLPFAWPAGTALPPIELPKADARKTWVAGLAAPMAAGGSQPLCVLSENHDSLLFFGDTPLKLQRTLKTGYQPYSCALSPDGRTLAVSNWGDQSISLFDLASNRETRVAMGAHPNELAWSRNRRLFIACSGDSSVCVLQEGRVIERIKTCLDPSLPVGSTPIALAISPDQSRLYVANADNNDVAVIDISNPLESRIMGLIPTGWYPSALAVSPDSRTLYVGVGKGMAFGPNAPRKNIGKLLNGAVEVIPIPNQAELGVYTKQVVSNTPVPERDTQASVAHQAILKNAFSQIKHVIWIIRENRTYDQVLGDLPNGNGDPSLAMFGKEVTPNAHALAQEFTLFDNLYCSAEVSQDGHQWCNAAYATDFTEKAWINSYSNRGQPDADERLSSSPGGYLWDNCRKHNLTYISYGEFGRLISSPDMAPVFTPVDPSLKGHISKAWAKLHGKRDYERVDTFINELHEAEKNNDFPAFTVMSLGEDHTHAGRVGYWTPKASVASNDLGLGKLVEAVSHSKYWPNTAIFVMEDDAQNGPDHVDAHRTEGFVISPFTRRHAVDSTLYTTVSFIHSMELMLKLPPMTQYDSSATPVFNAMMEQPNLKPFDHVEPLIDLTQKNPAKGPDAAASAKLDFSGYDLCDPAVLNAILWHMFKPDVPVPPPVRSVHWLQSKRDSGR
jgi:YVTN family beta-propeller protein